MKEINESIAIVSLQVAVVTSQDYDGKSTRRPSCPIS
jgi:hypothetical protein